MKTLLSIAGVFSGFLLSLGMFAAGLAFAAYFIAIEPERRPGLTADVADLWTAEPRRVDTSQQRLERVAALPPSPAAPPEAAAKAVARAGVDPVTTGAIESPPSEVGAAARIIALHVKWCADRYRSYQRYNNRYTSYSGEQRPCVSPFLKGQIGLAETVAPAPPEAFQSDPVEGGGGQAEIIEELPAPEEEVEAFSAPTNDANALPWLVEEGQELRAETAEELPAPEEEALPQYALDAEGWVDPDHVSYCFSRYRSYRPQDNSYQPFGGGPRRQCR